MAANLDSNPEYPDTHQHESVPAWRDVLERLLDHSGMWFMSDGSSAGGPKPKLVGKPADNKGGESDGG